MTPKKVTAALVTGEGANQYTTDAGLLGFFADGGPGEIPDSLETDLGNGRQLKFSGWDSATASYKQPHWPGLAAPITLRVFNATYTAHKRAEQAAQLTIQHRSGTEGPRHDPYSFVEWTVTADANREWRIHAGLGSWVRFNGNDVEIRNDDIDEALQRSGCPLSRREIEARHEAEREAPIKKHAPHGEPCWKDGMPGEQLLICPCGAVIESTFDVSAVE